jgi:hypothetical protein
LVVIVIRVMLIFSGRAAIHPYHLAGLCRRALGNEWVSLTFFRLNTTSAAFSRMSSTGTKHLDRDVY